MGNDETMTIRWQCVCVDAHEPGTLARWWAELLGWRLTYEEDDDEAVIEPPEGSPLSTSHPTSLFLKVPEDKAVKNRLHIDLRPDDQGAEVARAESLGARRVSIGQSDDVSWVVLADPEGNEFCILRALTPEELADSGARRGRFGPLPAVGLPSPPAGGLRPRRPLIRGR